MKKFYAVIGNPPYQDESVGDQKTYQKPIYPDFMDESYKVGERVELITPARFLFNAGSTPKNWNQKMLNDQHLKVAEYVSDSGSVFPSVEIKGGVAVTYRDGKKQIGPIGTFTPYPELNSIVHKIVDGDFISFKNIVVSRTAYRFTDIMHKEHPEVISQLSKGHLYDMSTNIFDLIPQVFSDNDPDDDEEYMRMFGRSGNNRITKWLKKSYVKVSAVPNFNSYKLAIPSASGAGIFGEALSAPIILAPRTGNTETFVSIGNFAKKDQCEACLKYVKSKFTRALLGIAKVTQHVTPESWKYVPLQDFTDNSDIDWSQPIVDIDHQLYRKYDFNDDEIAFIENEVKEMD